jgi:protein DJ-1
VTIASIHGNHPVTVSAGIVITPDVSLSDVSSQTFDAILLPGGEGYAALAASKLVGEIINSHYIRGKLICCICMSAHVLLAHKIAYGKKLTSYPYLDEALKLNYDYRDDDVVQDGNLITSRGPATVYKFTFKIIENLVGVEKAERKAKDNLF